MALSAWKGLDGGVIVDENGAVILCETCPCDTTPVSCCSGVVSLSVAYNYWGLSPIYLVVGWNYSFIWSWVNNGCPVRDAGFSTAGTVETQTSYNGVPGVVGGHTTITEANPKYGGGQIHLFDGGENGDVRCMRMRVGYRTIHPETSQYEYCYTPWTDWICVTLSGKP